MQALADSHMFVNKLTRQEFFRTAYYWKFEKDIPEVSLMEDVQDFQYQGKLRPYAIDYLIHCYGVH